MNDQQPQAQPFEGMPEPEQREQHQKTIAIRVDESLHAQLRFIAQLSGSTITDEIRRAIESRVTTAQDDPDLISRAQEAHDEIEREAAARSAAIAGFLGKPAVAAATEPTTDTAPKTRRARPTKSE
jgi:hypothetical protein